jgi:nucleoside-diphosphate-sugar epimerase
VGQVVNIGATQEGSIMALARRVIELTDSTSDIELVPYETAYLNGFEDMPRRVPDTTRIRALTGWTPEKSLDDIILDVARFLREAEGRD